MNMKKYFQRIMLVFLLITMVCTSCGRTVSVSPGLTDHTDSDDKNSHGISDDDEQGDDDKDDALKEQEAFDEFTDRFFTELVSLNVMNVHAVLEFPRERGITDYEYSLGKISREDSEEEKTFLQKFLDEIESFDYDLLTKDQQLTYDIVTTDLRESIDDEKYYLFSDYLSPLNGEPSNLPSYLCQFTFHDEYDVKDYLEILKLLPERFEDILTFQKEKTQAGMGMPDFELDEVIDQCREFVQQEEDHFMIVSFNERIDSLTNMTESEKISYKKTNEDLIRNTILPLYRNFAEELNQFHGKAVYEGGLCHFENGKDFYESLFRSETGSDQSVSEVYEMLTKQLESDISTYSLLLYQDKNMFDKAKNYSFDTSDPDQILHYLLEKIEKDFPDGFETEYKICNVPKAVEKYQSPAYYYIPAIDNPKNNNIFINHYEDYKKMDLYSVLAHECFPGHMYQSTYFQNTHPSDIRSLFRYSGYIEGWGLYSELYSYDLAGLSKPLARFNQVNSCLTYDVYCLCDIGVHYEGWDKQETIDYATSAGFQEDDAESIYESVLENPCEYMNYYIGYLEFMGMKKKAKAELGDSFNIKQFHQFLLDIGPAQFEIIHDRFDQWIENQRDHV